MSGELKRRPDIQWSEATPLTAAKEGPLFLDGVTARQSRRD